MSKLRLIEKTTDISRLEMTKMPWDVEVYGIPYQVVSIKGYVHTIGGRHGENDLWMYPRNESPSYKNLIEYQCDGCGVCWGIKYEPHNYIRSKCFTSGGVTITRNGKDFYFCRGGIDEARALIRKLDEHPISLNEYGWEDKVVGRKVWWRSEPAVVRSYIYKQACVMLEPDGIKKFTTPAEFADEEGDNYYEDGDVKAEIFDAHIWWFRD